jgi:hypothetical protein
MHDYDVTFFGPKGGTMPTHEEFIKLIRPLFKKWAFQEEECPTLERNTTKVEDPSSRRSVIPSYVMYIA